MGVVEDSPAGLSSKTNHSSASPVISTPMARHAAAAASTSAADSSPFWFVAAVAGFPALLPGDGGRALDFALAFAFASVKWGSFLGHSDSVALHFPSAKSQQH